MPGAFRRVENGYSDRCRFISLGRINKGMGDGEFHPGFVINQPSAFQLSELFKKTSTPARISSSLAI
jgi:hypothetical protein